MVTVCCVMLVGYGVKYQVVNIISSLLLGDLQHGGMVQGEVPKIVPDPLNSTANMSTTKYWLLKAEPDSRVVKGKDVKVRVSYFLVSHFF